MLGKEHLPRTMEKPTLVFSWSERGWSGLEPNLYFNIPLGKYQCGESSKSSSLFVSWLKRNKEYYSLVGCCEDQMQQSWHSEPNVWKNLGNVRQANE